MYSLHRSSSCALTQASALDIENFHEWDTNLLTNSIGSIQLSGIEVLPKGQRPKRENSLPSVPSKPALPRVQSAPKQRIGKEETPAVARSFFDKKSTSAPSKSKATGAIRPPIDPKATSSDKKLPDPIPSKSTKSESSNPLIASEDEDDQSQKEETKNNRAEESEQVVEDDVDEDEWEEGGFNTGGNYVLNKEKIKKRDDIQSINSHFIDDVSSEEDDETSKDVKGTKQKTKKKGKKRSSDGDDVRSDEESEKKLKKSKKKQNKEDDLPEHKVQIHGAMDDFFEDMARKQSDIPVVKKKKTKLVEKVRLIFLMSIHRSDSDRLV